MSEETLYIEYMTLAQIQRAARNPKDHDIGVMHRSMERFGYTNPMAINERTGRLVWGHGRLETLEQKKANGEAPPKRIKVDPDTGEWRAPVLRGLSFETDEEAEAYVITDNRLTELGGWDDSDLAEVLKEIEEFDDVLLLATGFDGDDLEELLEGLTPITHTTHTPNQEESLEIFNNNTIKQIVLYFDTKPYIEMVAQLQRLKDRESLESNTDALVFLMRFWEKSKKLPKIDPAALEENDETKRAAS